MHASDSTNPDFPHLTHVVPTAVTWRQLVDWSLLPAIRDDCRASAATRATDASRCDGSHSEPSIKRQNAGSKDVAGPALSKSLPRPLALNRFAGCAAVLDPIHRSLRLPFHQHIPVPTAVVHTARYLFHHVRAAIYVRIRGNKLTHFLPFVNKDYRNNVLTSRHCACVSSCSLTGCGPCAVG